MYKQIIKRRNKPVAHNAMFAGRQNYDHKMRMKVTKPTPDKRTDAIKQSGQ